MVLSKEQMRNLTVISFLLMISFVLIILYTNSEDYAGQATKVAPEDLVARDALPAESGGSLDIVPEDMSSSEIIADCVDCKNDKSNAEDVSVSSTVISEEDRLSVQASNWYVDNDASGSNSGTSWANAWESFADIDWNAIQPGDIIYISGGPTTGSKIYNEGLEIYGISGTAANPITITKGIDPAHNGRVIIQGPYNGEGNGIKVNGNYQPSVDYVTLKGFDIRGWQSGIHVEDYASYIIIDSMNITEWYDLAGVFLNGVPNGDNTKNGIDHVTIRNSNFVTFLNEVGQQDGIYMAGVSNIVIHDNYLYIKNQDPMAHTDGIQTGMEAEGLKIYNNVIISSAVYSPQGGGVPLILAAHGPNPVIIYNNFLYMGGVWDPDAYWGSGVIDLHGWDIQSFSDQPPAYVLHNTIISNGPRIRTLGFTYFGTNSTNAYMKNNIVAQYGLGGSHGGGDWLETFSNSRPSPQTINVNNMGHNLWWREWGSPAINGPFTNGVTTIDSPTWTQWTTTLGGTGVNSNPLFVGNKRLEWTDPVIFEKQAVMEGSLQSNSPAINQGENIQALVQSLGLPWTDINGNPRDSTPTIGAYEVEGSDCTVTVQPGQSIQSVVNAASSGDIICIAEGTYNGRVTVNTPGITIKGQTRRTATVVDGFDVNAPNVRIEGLKMTTSTPPWPSIVFLDTNADYAKIYDNYFYEINGVVIRAETGNLGDASFVHVKDNTMYRVNWGIHVSGDNWIVENNEIDTLVKFIDWLDNDYVVIWGNNHIFRNNYFHGTNGNSIGDSHMNCFQTYDWTNPYTVHNILIENNTCFGFHEFLRLQAWSNKHDNVTIRNNIMVVFPDTGFLNNNALPVRHIVVESAPNVTIEHNTMIGANPDNVISMEGTTSGSIKNNLIANMPTGYDANYCVQAGCVVAVGYNMIWNYTQSAGSPSSSTNILQSTGFVNPIVTNDRSNWMPTNPVACTGGEGGTYIGAVPCDSSPPPVCTDTDGDGYGSPASSSCTYSSLDCNNNNPNIHPGATEVCGNQVDEDCSGSDLSCSVPVFNVDVIVEAENGVIVAPMTNSGGIVSSSVDDSGTASFTFNVTQAGTYKLEANLVTSGVADNSFFVSGPGGEDIFDAAYPLNSAWDNVSWRGSGTVDVNQYDPKNWSLSPGLTTFVFRGRETGTGLDKVRLSQVSGGAIQNVTANCTVTVNPGQSIQSAVNVASSGAVICIAPGTYTGRITVNNPGITIKGQSRRTATIVNGFEINVPNVRIEGLRITTNTFLSTAVMLWEDADNTKIYDNYFYNVSAGSSIWGPLGSVDTSDNVHVKDNLFYRVQIGIHAVGNNWIIENNEIDTLYQFGSGGCQYNRFHGSNQIWRNNYWHGATLANTGSGHVDCFQTWDQGNPHLTRNVTIENNTCINFHAFGMIQAQEGGGQLDGLKIRNNIGYVRPESGYLDTAFALNIEDATNMVIEHNTFIGATWHSIYFNDIGSSDHPSGVMKNNIIMSVGDEAWNANGCQGDCLIKNNLWWSSLNPTPYPDSTNINANPQLTDINNLNFKPLPGSPACTGGEGGTYIGAVPCDVLPVCNDADADGYGSPASSSCTYSSLDCNDNNANINPGATEICGNQVDEDCNGADLSCPSISCSVSIVENANPSHQHVVNNSVYYNNRTGGSFNVTVTGSNVLGVVFPATVSAGVNDTVAPFVRTYTWNNADVFSGVANIVAYNGSITGNCSFYVIKDVVPPSGGSIGYPDGNITGTTVILGLDSGMDNQSGIYNSSRILQRQSCLNCTNNFSSWSLLATGISGTYTDNSLNEYTCYRYRYMVSDNVNNSVVYSNGNIVCSFEEFVPNVIIDNSTKWNSTFNRSGHRSNFTFYNEYVRVLIKNVLFYRNLYLNGTNINLSFRKIHLDSVAIPEFDTESELEFYNISFHNPVVYRDGVLCDLHCENYTYNPDSGTYYLNVTGFSEYEIVEGEYCGDNSCNNGESCSSCVSDCGVCVTDSSGGGSGGGGGGGGRGGGSGGSYYVRPSNVSNNASVNSNSVSDGDDSGTAYTNEENLLGESQNSVNSQDGQTGSVEKPEEGSLISTYLSTFMLILLGVGVIGASISAAAWHHRIPPSSPLKNNVVAQSPMDSSLSKGIDYVNAMHMRGYNDTYIKERLKSVGWTDEHIQRLFQNIK